MAERAIAGEDPTLKVAALTDVVREQVGRRFGRILDLGAAADVDVAAARAYVSAVLGLQVWAHHLARAASADPHEHG